MYDSTSGTDIPADAVMVAGYVDGIYRWPQSDWDRFPDAVKVRIAVFASTNDGHVLDVEYQDATPAQAPGWVQKRRAAGVDPTIYCSEFASGYSWAEVRAAFQAQGVPEPHYWIANYNGRQTIPGGAVAHQYAGDAASGGHYDLSVVADYWPGVDPPPEAEMSFDRTIYPFGTRAAPVQRTWIVRKGTTLEGYDPLQPGAPVQTVTFDADSSAQADAEVWINWIGPPPGAPIGGPFLRVTDGGYAGQLILESTVELQPAPAVPGPTPPVATVPATLTSTTSPDGQSVTVTIKQGG